MGVYPGGDGPGRGRGIDLQADKAGSYVALSLSSSASKLLSLKLDPEEGARRKMVFFIFAVLSRGRLVNGGKGGMDSGALGPYLEGVILVHRGASPDGAMGGLP